MASIYVQVVRIIGALSPYSYVFHDKSLVTWCCCLWIIAEWIQRWWLSMSQSCSPGTQISCEALTNSCHGVTKYLRVDKEGKVASDGIIGTWAGLWLYWLNKSFIRSPLCYVWLINIASAWFLSYGTSVPSSTPTNCLLGLWSIQNSGFILTLQ